MSTENQGNGNDTATTKESQAPAKVDKHRPSVIDVMQGVTDEHEIPHDPRARMCLIFAITYTFLPDLFGLLIALKPNIFANNGISDCNKISNLRLFLFLGSISFIAVFLLMLIFGYCTHHAHRKEMFHKSDGSHDCKGCSIVGKSLIFGAIAFWFYLIFEGISSFIGFSDSCQNTSLAQMMLLWSILKIIPVTCSACISFASVSHKH